MFHKKEAKRYLVYHPISDRSSARESRDNNRTSKMIFKSTRRAGSSSDM